MGLKELLRQEGFQQGFQQGYQEIRQKNIARLLQDGLYDTAGIARVMHVTEEDVLRINEFLNFQLHQIKSGESVMGLKELLKEEGIQEGISQKQTEGITELLKDGLYDTAGIARVMHVTEKEVLRINELLNFQLH